MVFGDVHVIVCLLVAIVAMITVYWLSRGGVRRTADRENQVDVDRAREILIGLHDWAGRLSAVVSEHESRVEEVNKDLTSTEAPSMGAVLKAVINLAEASQQMQQRLASAEAKLKEQVKIIDSQQVKDRR